ncbi:MAG: hypothetical protein MJ252_20835 [archaeon]|nr:hypothetical protein [archaeon]
MDKNMDNSLDIKAQKEKHFKCEHCLKYFTTNGNLKSHIENVHLKKKPFKCTYAGCNKAYSLEKRLEIHLRTHSGIKPFECDICGKTFNEKGNLKTHRQFHETERQFKCQICDKTYKTKAHLKDHYNVEHLKTKNFTCSLCNKAFGRKSSLQSHLKIHSGTKPFKCLVEGCEKTFAIKGNMIAHYKRHLKSLGQDPNQFPISQDINQPLNLELSEIKMEDLNGGLSEELSEIRMEEIKESNINVIHGGYTDSKNEDKSQEKSEDKCFGLNPNMFKFDYKDDSGNFDLVEEEIEKEKDCLQLKRSPLHCFPLSMRSSKPFTNFDLETDDVQKQILSEENNFWKDEVDEINYGNGIFDTPFD